MLVQQNGGLWSNGVWNPFILINNRSRIVCWLTVGRSNIDIVSNRCSFGVIAISICWLDTKAWRIWILYPFWTRVWLGLGQCLVKSRKYLPFLSINLAWHDLNSFLHWFSWFCCIVIFWINFSIFIFGTSSSNFHLNSRAPGYPS